MGRFFLFTVIFAITLIVLFFPIFITISCYLNVKEQKLCFCFNVFNRIRIKGGYFTRYDKGIVVHLNKNRAVLMPYKKFNPRTKKFSMIKSFEFISLKGVFEGDIEKIIPFFLLNRVLNILKTPESQLNSFDFCFWITEKESFKFTAEATLFYTNFLLFIELFEFLGRKIKCQLKTKKSII